MSAVLDTAIMTRLTGTESPALSAAALAVKAALALLLAADPDTGSPAVFKSALNRSALVYPCVTFRPAGGGRHPLMMAGVIGEHIYDFEVWDQSEDDTNASAIADYLEQLLDYNRGVVPKLVVSQGRNFWMEAFTGSAQRWSEQYNATFLMVRYRFIWSRA